MPAESVGCFSVSIAHLTDEAFRFMNMSHPSAYSDFACNFHQQCFADFTIQVRHLQGSVYSVGVLMAL